VLGIVIEKKLASKSKPLQRCMAFLASFWQPTFHFSYREWLLYDACLYHRAAVFNSWYCYDISWQFPLHLWVVTIHVSLTSPSFCFQWSITFHQSLHYYLQSLYRFMEIKCCHTSSTKPVSEELPTDKEK